MVSALALSKNFLTLMDMESSDITSSCRPGLNGIKAPCSEFFIGVSLVNTELFEVSPLLPISIDNRLVVSARSVGLTSPVSKIPVGKINIRCSSSCDFKK
jgi:hypothetical protein